MLQPPMYFFILGDKVNELRMWPLSWGEVALNPQMGCPSFPSEVNIKRGFTQKTVLSLYMSDTYFFIL